MSDKYIDIKEVIRKKNPRLLKWMPGFLLSYIKRILHENEINDFMSKHGHLQDFAFLKQVFEYFNVKIELKGAENIISSGGAIFAANHPLGGMDGMAFMLGLSDYRKDIKFLVNDILMNIKNLSNLFIPVNKHGSHGRAAAKHIEDAYADQHALLVFPAGLVSRKQKGGVKDLEWKKSFITKAKKYQKPIVPVYITGENSKFFYNLAKLRKSLGIKANIEMFYLADEMFKQGGKTVTIYIGKPLTPDYFDKSKSEKDWAEHVKELVYALPN
jgi:putative hemolysin